MSLGRSLLSFLLKSIPRSALWLAGGVALSASGAGGGRALRPPAGEVLKAACTHASVHSVHVLRTAPSTALSCPWEAKISFPLRKDSEAVSSLFRSQMTSVKAADLFREKEDGR